MPQFDTDPILQIQYNSATAGQEYSYAGLALIAGIPDEAQLDIRWSTTLVYTAPNNGGTAVPVSELSPAAQDAIISLDINTQYTVVAESKLVTLNVSAIENQPIVVGSVTYYYPQVLSITPAANITVRRSTDITSQAVVFQPGSRLTSDLLNTSSAQVFNAVQELAEFGVGEVSGGGEADLSSASINELGDVNLTVTGLTYWDNSTQQLTSGGASGGTLVPDPTAALDGQALLKNVPADAGQDISWQYITFDEVKDPNNSGVNLTDVQATTATDISNLQLKTTGFTRDAVTTTTTFSDTVVGADFTGAEFTASLLDINTVDGATALRIDNTGTGNTSSFSIDLADTDGVSFRMAEASSEFGFYDNNSDLIAKLTNTGDTELIGTTNIVETEDSTNSISSRPQNIGSTSVAFGVRENGFFNAYIQGDGRIRKVATGALSSTDVLNLGELDARYGGQIQRGSDSLGYATSSNFVESLAGTSSANPFSTTAYFLTPRFASGVNALTSTVIHNLANAYTGYMTYATPTNFLTRADANSSYQFEYLVISNSSGAMNTVYRRGILTGQQIADQFDLDANLSPATGTYTATDNFAILNTTFRRYSVNISYWRVY